MRGVPICGDSQKDQFKARFYYYYYNNQAFVNCFNCTYSAPFYRFLKEHDEEVYNEYQMEKFKESGESKPKVEASPKLKAVMPVPTIQQLAFSERLDKLDKSHPIIAYVSGRKIPEDQWDRLWFTAKWQELCNSVKPDTFPKPRPEYRLVIPIFNKDGKIESFQGRALKAAPNKYMTIKADEKSTKIYGQDRIDESKDHVFILEGPIDTLFLDNALAITGGSLNLASVPYPDKRIWVLDNEPRHRDTIARMRTLIEAGEKVLFWDEAPWKKKDINDMVEKEGATKAQLEEYILSHWAEGIMAEIKMSDYCKI